MVCVQDPCSLKDYAKAVEEQVNIKLDDLRNGEQANAFTDAMSEIKEIVTQAMESSKAKLGRGTMMTTMTVG